MTIDRMVELLKIEHECMLRKSHGDCDGQCEACNLVQDDGELHEMYENVIGLVKAQEPVGPKKVNRYFDFDDEGHPYNPETYDCGACGKELPWKVNYCPECGRKVYWV